MGLKLRLCCAWRQPPSPPHPWKQLPPSPAQLCPGSGAGGSLLFSLGTDVSPLLSPSLPVSQGRTNCCVGGVGAATHAFVPCWLHLGSHSPLPAPHPPAHTNRGGGHVPHSCYTLILWMEHHCELCPPAARLGKRRMLVGSANAMIEGWL